MPAKIPLYKVVLLGSGGVGKSALTIRFVKGVFVNTYDATVEDFYQANVSNFNDSKESCRLEILDTAGTEHFESMRELYIRNGQAFLVVFSLTNRGSFSEANNLYHQIGEIKRQQGLLNHQKLVDAFPIVLVGNKCDVTPAQVTREEAEQLAKVLGCQYIEASAKDGQGVVETFHTIIGLLHEKQSAKKRKYMCLSCLGRSAP